jgi:integrase
MPDLPKTIRTSTHAAWRVRPRGKRGPHDGRYYWRIVDGERRPVENLWASPAEVEKRLAELLLMPPEEPRPQGAVEVQTVKDLAGWWLAVHYPEQSTNPHTLNANRSSTVRLMAHGLGAVSVEDLQSYHLENWQARQLSAGRAERTVYHDTRTMGRVWEWGRKVGATPDRELTLPEWNEAKIKPARPKHTPTSAEVLAVVEDLQQNAPPWVSAVVRFVAAVGCRIGEAAELRWDGVDLDAGLVTLRGKTGERTVPVLPETLAMLAELPRDRPWVFGKLPSTVRVIGDFLRPSCERAGVVPFTPHGLRRRAIDAMLDAGFDPGTVADVSGNSPNTVFRYYRARGDKRRQREALLRAALEVGGDGKVVPFPGQARKEEG